MPIIIYHPGTALEAVMLRKANRETAVYLAGGTEDLRLGAPEKDLIDLSALGFDTIEDLGDKVRIGARCTLQQIYECELIPAFLREAAHLCASYVRRCSATVGGNLAARRQDSYLAAAFTAADAVLTAMTPHGEQETPIGAYLQGSCIRLLEYITVDKNRTGWVKRFGNTAAGHAAVIAAESEGVYGLSVSGSPFLYGTDKPEVPVSASCGCHKEEEAPAPRGSFREQLEALPFTDDLTGSAEYKKYLAMTAFAPGGSK